MSHGKIVYQLGDERCSFCCEHEMIPHLFFECTMAKYFWSLVALVLGDLICRATQRSARDSGLQEMEFASRKKII